ncbi:MAG: alpha/beta hydrolase [Acidimicrobiales bacterium]
MGRPNRAMVAARMAAVVGAILVAVVSLTDADPTTENELVRYGDDPSEFGRLWIPEVRGDSPVVILVHGGFWRVRAGDSTLMDPLARDLHADGYAVWNIEYGRVGERFGGWPHTFDHVGTAIDHLVSLAETHPIDLARVAVVGHSAGGQLAVWSGGRSLLEADDPGGSPAVEPVLVVGLAPVLDLDASAADLLGNGAVVDLLGGTPAEVRDRYRVAQPVIGSAEVVVVVGSADQIVPAAYSAFERAIVIRHPGNHFLPIDPGSEPWEAVRNVLRDRL